MTMSKIIFTNSKGIISVIHPISGDANDAIKDVPVGISTYSIVEDSVIPTDGSFRDSWVGNGVGVSTATIVEDMTKAKEIHKTKIRTARVDKFDALDVEFQKALETSADTSTIVAKKQALRDAPAASGISTAASTDDLKAQWDTTNLGTSPYT